MNARILFSLLLGGTLCAAGPYTFAKIHRINNNGFGAQYAQINAANNDPNVMAGDTIHLEGSSTFYNSATVNKPLVIIGPGYFLTQNPKTTHGAAMATINGISFVAGSAGSKLIGVSVDFYSISMYNTSNITVKRCMTTGDIALGQNLSNITIVQNFFGNYGSSTGTSTAIDAFYGVPSGTVVNNNIFLRTMIFPTSVTSVLADCNNNVFDGPSIVGTPSLRFYASSFKNNILTSATATVNINGNSNLATNPNPAVTHNVSASAAIQFGTANNNIAATPANLFVSASTNSTDGKYQLLPSSPASANGSDGSDRGAFGGAAIQNRYTLSGLAPIPVVYGVNTTGVASPTTGLPVTVGSRTIQ